MYALDEFKTLQVAVIEVVEVGNADVVKTVGREPRLSRNVGFVWGWHAGVALTNKSFSDDFDVAAFWFSVCSIIRANEPHKVWLVRLNARDQRLWGTAHGKDENGLHRRGPF